MSLRRRLRCLYRDLKSYEFEKLKERKERIPRIVSDTIKDGVAIARGCGEGGCGEGVVTGRTNDKEFSSPGFSIAACFLSLLHRLFDFCLRVSGGGGGVGGRKSAV